MFNTIERFQISNKWIDLIIIKPNSTYQTVLLRFCVSDILTNVVSTLNNNSRMPKGF